MKAETTELKIIADYYALRDCTQFCVTGLGDHSGTRPSKTTAM